MSTEQAAIAAHRFGLGEASLDVVRGDARGWLAAQIGPADAQITVGSDPLPSAKISACEFLRVHGNASPTPAAGRIDGRRAFRRTASSASTSARWCWPTRARAWAPRPPRSACSPSAWRSSGPTTARRTLNQEHRKKRYGLLNLNFRDPVMYRILHMAHHRTGDEWCIYPMYDYAHGQSDSIEGVTPIRSARLNLTTIVHFITGSSSNWNLSLAAVRIDRLSVTYTLLRKRKLLKLVQDGRVAGWDDPRMPTLSGLRRRGYTPEAIRTFLCQHRSFEDQRGNPACPSRVLSA
jgi:hypothetical protein